MTRHTRRASTTWVIVAALLVAVVAIGGCASKVVVPDVSKLPYEQAKTVLESKGLTVLVRAELPDEAVPKDAVAAQEPAPGTEVKKGTEVGLTISTGPEGLPLPNVVGKTTEEAKAALRDLGLRFKVSKRVDEANVGKVVNQSPEASTTVLPDQEIELFVGEAPPTPIPETAPATTNADPDPPASSGNSSSGNSSGGGSGFVVAIDPGHQAQANSSQEPVGPGSSTTKAKVTGGASGASTGQKESQLNLNVALKLEKALKAKGVKVVMTRRTQDVNISNAERAQISNRAGADLFIRIHADSAGGSASGSKTLVPSRNQYSGSIYEQSRRAAAKVQPQLVAATGFPNDGIVERGDITGFNWSKAPVILIEMGFLSNGSEDRQLAQSSTQQRIADKVAAGIMSYLKS